MMRVCDSISAVNEAIRYGTPWTAFLEYRGPNDKVACGFSDKWWEITGTSDGRVEINYGASGSAGLSSPIMKWPDEGVKVLHQKLAKGYRFKRAVRLSPLAHMPPPFCDIVRIEMGGLKSANALNTVGRLVAQLPLSTARDLCDRYPELCA
jgi:hypothetical protein